MCYAIPGKVKSVDGEKVILDYFGEEKEAINFEFKLEVEDYVYAQGGVVVDLISKEKAKKILNFWEDRFFELLDKDEEQYVDLSDASPFLRKIVDKVKKEINLSEEELRYLLKIERPGELQVLIALANNSRRKEIKNSSCVHGIIEFSNYCKNKCVYCGINSDKNIERYRISEDEIIDIASDAVNRIGFRALVLQSGEDDYYDVKKLKKIVKGIKDKCGVLIFLSVGETISIEDYKELFKIGAKGVLFRFETSNKELYNKLHPGMSFDTRMDYLENLSKIGFLIATGGLIGLPGQTEDDILKDIMLVKKFNSDMYSFGPVLGYGNEPSVNLVIKTLAVSRLADPKATVLATTALETLDENALEEGLLAGANSLMVNVTPGKYKEMYSLYPDKAHKDEEIRKNIKQVTDLLYNLGRAPTDISVKK